MGCSNTNTKDQLKNEANNEINKKKTNEKVVEERSEKREKEEKKDSKKGRCKPKTVTKGIKKSEDLPTGAIDFFDGVLVDNCTSVFPLLIGSEEELDNFAPDIADQIPTYVSKIEGAKPDVIWVQNVDDRINGYNYDINWSKEKMVITKGAKLNELGNRDDKVYISYSTEMAKENHYYCYIIETSNKSIEEINQSMGNNFIEQRVVNNGPMFIEQRVVNDKVPVFVEEN